jgi:hypothetical protein
MSAGGSKLDLGFNFSPETSIAAGVLTGLSEWVKQKKAAEMQQAQLNIELQKTLLPVQMREAGLEARHEEEMTVRREELEAEKEVGLKGVEARLWSVLGNIQEAKTSADARRYAADQALEGSKARADATVQASAKRGAASLAGTIYSADAMERARVYASDKLYASATEGLTHRDKWEADRNLALKEIQQMKGDVSVKINEIKESRELTAEQEYSLERYKKLSSIPYSIMYMAYSSEDRDTRNNLMDLAAEMSQYAFTEFMTNVEPITGGSPLVPVFESKEAGGLIWKKKGLEITEPEVRPEGWDFYLRAATKPVDETDAAYLEGEGWSQEQIEELRNAVESKLGEK